MKCFNCGLILPEGYTFCTGCGKPLSGRAQTPAGTPFGGAEILTNAQLRNDPANSAAKIADLRDPDMTFIGYVPGSIKKFDDNWQDYKGYFIVFTGEISFFEYDFYDTDAEPFTPDYCNAHMRDKYNFYIPLKALHSVKVWSMVGTGEYTFYLYNNTRITIEIEGGKNCKYFDEMLAKAAADLLIVKQKTFAEYYPNIGKYDPRNPFGARYDPDYPRGYVVANTKGMNKKPGVIDEAIAAAKKDGTLPPYWHLRERGISETNLPPGVPTIYATF